MQLLRADANLRAEAELEAVRETRRSIDVDRRRITLLAGHSGVGKSTLLNLLVPEAHARTAEISAVHGTGMHTTTFSELFDLPNQAGSLIDIPGIKGFGTFDMEIEEVSHYFREIFAVAADCRP